LRTISSAAGFEASRRLALALSAVVGQPKTVIDALQAHGLSAALPFWSLLLSQAQNASERLTAQALMAEFTSTVSGCVNLPDDAFRSKFTVPNLGNLRSLEPSFGGGERHEGQVVFDRLTAIAKEDAAGHAARVEDARSQAKSLLRTEAIAQIGEVGAPFKRIELWEELLRPLESVTEVVRDFTANPLMPLAIANINPHWALVFYFERTIILDQNVVLGQGLAIVEIDVSVVSTTDAKLGVRLPIGERAKKWQLLASIPGLRVAYVAASSLPEAKMNMRALGLVVAAIWPRLCLGLSNFE
jgi:hypothetical protein